MPIKIIHAGVSRSFPADNDLGAIESTGNGLIIIGADAGRAFAELPDAGQYPLVAIELGNECLAEHIGLEAGAENSRIIGFARFRMGDAAPSKLVEIVRLPSTHPEALASARTAFESLGLVVAVCGDFPGRIVDRLIRPYLNAVLRRYDEQLATAEDLDTTLRLGLGYPEGPLALLDRTGLANHFDITQKLYEALGNPDYAPARRARVAKQRSSVT